MIDKSKLELAIAEADAQLEANGVIVQGGKKYLMVKDRVIIFRKHYGDEWGIETSVISTDNSRVAVQARVINCDGLVIGCGTGEEERGTSGVNSTSALENAETSAIGRALASLGLHGGEYASADEIVQAINNQPQRTTIAQPTSKKFDEDWQNVIVPNTKNKGKKLGELSHKQLQWYIENWQPWAGKDGDLEPSQEHKNFRSAIDSANKAVFSTGKEIQLDVPDEVAEQTAGHDPDLDEDVPF